MKVLRFIQDGEFIQLGIDEKKLSLKWGDLLQPMQLGRLEDIKSLAKQRDVSFGGQTRAVPEIIKKMGKQITDDGIKMSKKMTEKAFFEDFVNDYNEMEDEGLLKFIGVFDEWD